MGWNRRLIVVTPKREAEARSHPVRFLLGESFRLASVMALVMLFLEWTGATGPSAYTPRNRLFFAVGWGALMAAFQLIMIRLGTAAETEPRERSGT